MCLFQSWRLRITGNTGLQWSVYVLILMNANTPFQVLHVIPYWGSNELDIWICIIYWSIWPFWCLILKSLSLVSSVSLHFLSLWLAALVLIVSSCVIASSALILSTCVSFPSVQSPPPACVFKPCLSHSPVWLRTVWFVFVLFGAKDSIFCGPLLAFGFCLSLTTTSWQC